MPFRSTSYPATPTLSVDGDHETVAPVPVTFEAFNPVGAEGACVSAHALVEAITTACCERLPAASTASTASV